MKPRLAVVAASCFSCTIAMAEVVTTCGPSDGHAFYYEGVAVPKAKAGMQKDAISGTFQIVRDGEVYDIFYTDSTGGTRSARGEGGRVSGASPAPDQHVVQVLYDAGSIDVYMLKGKVATLSTVRWGGLIQKASLMKANCR